MVVGSAGLSRYQNGPTALTEGVQPATKNSSKQGAANRPNRMPVKTRFASPIGPSRVAAMTDQYAMTKNSIGGAYTTNTPSWETAAS